MTIILHWLFIVLLCIAIFIAVLYRNKRARLQCPNCKKSFGRKAASRIKPYYKDTILDGPLFASDGCTGKDGFIIHCEECEIDILFENKII